MIQVSVINESPVITDADVQAMIPAFQIQWNRDLAPVWDLTEAQFTWSDKTRRARFVRDLLGLRDLRPRGGRAVRV